MENSFTVNTRLGKIAGCKEFKPFKRYLLVPRRKAWFLKHRKLGCLKNYFNIDPQETARMFNAMRGGICAGRITCRRLSHEGALLYPFIIGKNRPFVLVLAGGGYDDVCSIIEAFPMALKLNELGYNAFAGRYRVGRDALYPSPLDDVAEMISLIFREGGAMGVSLDSYAVCGFSAGGHLAACWGTKAHGWAKYGLPKPDTMILSYPVITMGEYTHAGSRDRIAGRGAGRALLDSLSAEKAVDSSYPRTFLWQCTGDGEVPFRNSELMAEALKNNGCEYELFAPVYNKHGIALGNGTPAEGWIDRAVKFWQRQ